MKKINPKYIALIILIILLCFLSWCQGRDSVKPVNTIQPEKPDTIRPKIQVNKADIKNFADSIPILKAKLLQATNRKNYYKELYKSTHDSLHSISDSVCKSYLTLVNRVKEKQDSAHEAENEANSQLIINAFNQIGEYQDNEILYEEKIKQDSTDKAQAKKDFEKQLNASNWKWFWKGYRWGFGTGAVATQGVNSGIRMIKP